MITSNSLKLTLRSALFIIGVALLSACAKTPSEVLPTDDELPTDKYYIPTYSLTQDERIEIDTQRQEYEDYLNTL